MRKYDLITIFKNLFLNPVIQNFRFFFKERILGTDILCSLLKLDPIALKNYSTFEIYNPSAISFKNNIFFISRANKFSNKNPKKHIAINYIHKFDSNFNLLKFTKLDDQLLKNQSVEAKDGIEDIRLFLWNSSLWGIGAGLQWDGNSYKISQILIKIHNYKIIKFYVLKSPFNKYQEKNWSPIVKNGELFLLYSIEPLQVYKFRKAKLLLYKSEVNFDIKNIKIRGGTPPIKFFGNSYLGMAHKAPATLFGRKFYRQLFYLLDNKFNLIFVTKEFFIEKIGIEFPCGMTLLNSELLISYGSKDRDSRYINFPSSKLVNFLNENLIK